MRYVEVVWIGRQAARLSLQYQERGDPKIASFPKLEFYDMSGDDSTELSVYSEFHFVHLRQVGSQRFGTRNEARSAIMTIMIIMTVNEVYYKNRKGLLTRGIRWVTCYIYICTLSSYLFYDHGRMNERFDQKLGPRITIKQALY